MESTINFLILDDESLLLLTDDDMKEYNKAVEKDKRKREGIINFYIGKMMEATKGRANPKKAREIVERTIDEISMTDEEKIITK